MQQYLVPESLSYLNEVGFTLGVVSVQVIELVGFFYGRARINETEVTGAAVMDGAKFGGREFLLIDRHPHFQRRFLAAEDTGGHCLSPRVQSELSVGLPLRIISRLERALPMDGGTYSNHASHALPTSQLPCSSFNARRNAASTLSFASSDRERQTFRNSAMSSSSRTISTGLCLFMTPLPGHSPRVAAVLSVKHLRRLEQEPSIPHSKSYHLVEATPGESFWSRVIELSDYDHYVLVVPRLRPHRPRCRALIAHLER